MFSTPNHSKSAGRRRHGVTLVEAVICSVVVGVMLVAALGTIGAAATANRVGASQNRANALASMLMSEILQQPYQQPGATNPPLGLDGSENNGDRSTWNDVDDYNGFSSSTPRYPDKSRVPNYDNWQWQANVAWVDPQDPGSTVSSDMGLKRVTVTVTDLQGRKTTLVALRGKFDLYDQPPTSITKYVQQVGLSLQLGTDSNASVIDGVNLLNPVPTQ